MIIKIGQPEAFTEQGLKDQQEDRLYPTINQLTDQIKCFVLCDGMGGHEQGEVAADIVSKTLYNNIMSSFPKDGMLTREWFNNCLKGAYNELDKMTYHSERRPGTTLTCVILGANGLLAAHIGDSRIYLVRPGKGIIFRTEDHSLVNQLIRAGELTEEEAVNFPRKNVITRAMQPGLDRPYAADLHLITDIQAGDYIFMCCDGILEQLSDKRLSEIVSQDTPASQKLADIYDTCIGKTRDNFTCYLIPVTDVEGPIPVAQDTDSTRVLKDEPMMVEPERVNVYGTKTNQTGAPVRTKNKPQNSEPNHPKLSGTAIAVISFLCTVALAVAVYFIFLKPADTAVNTPAPTAGTTQQTTASATGSGNTKPSAGQEPDKQTVEDNKHEADDKESEEINKQRQNAYNKFKADFQKFYKDAGAGNQTRIKKFLKSGNPDELKKSKDILDSFLARYNVKATDLTKDESMRKALLSIIEAEKPDVKIEDIDIIINALI